VQAGNCLHNLLKDIAAPEDGRTPGQDLLEGVLF
jgi:hypothetical protein